MNTSKVAAALNTLSLGIAELAEALTDGPMTLGDAERALRVTEGVSAAPEAMPAFPPMDYEDVPLAAETPGLGRCPFHNTPWTVKAGGVSKAGKSYNSFWKCDGKNPDDTFCARKPVKSWADTHPIGA